jgi:hypothetical protein
VLWVTTSSRDLAHRSPTFSLSWRLSLWSSPQLRSGGPSCVLGVKGKVLAIDLPHELRAKFNGLFELLFGLGL